MGSSTDNLGLYKPDVREHDWGASVNTNWDLLDRYGLVGTLFHGRAQNTPNMTLQVDAGYAYITGSAQPARFVGGNSPAFTLPTGSGCRVDLLVWGAGGLAIVQGPEQPFCTGSANFPEPTFPIDNVPIAEVYLRPSGTAINDTDVGYDHFVLRDVRPWMVWPPRM